jgi:hypothetical protein
VEGGVTAEELCATFERPEAKFPALELPENPKKQLGMRSPAVLVGLIADRNSETSSSSRMEMEMEQEQEQQRLEMN